MLKKLKEAKQKNKKVEDSIKFIEDNIKRKQKRKKLQKRKKKQTKNVLYLFISSWVKKQTKCNVVALLGV